MFYISPLCAAIENNCNEIVKLLLTNEFHSSEINVNLKSTIKIDVKNLLFLLYLTFIFNEISIYYDFNIILIHILLYDSNKYLFFIRF